MESSACIVDLPCFGQMQMVIVQLENEPGDLHEYRFNAAPAMPYLQFAEYPEFQAV